ncbi:chaperone modulator CbpM [Flavobacterium antarcticum]|uniref:chaperone modulator CbpM n=1 Tax=Flavobacterium antarcticum TaxID=271155 RepID=UPI0003B6C89D|nr:chaperone modulator CbpM [Flavobacterium antarcticum]
MENTELIIVEVFCAEYRVEPALIEELNEFGLIDFVQTNGQNYIHSDHLRQIEKIIQFHNELNINKEGIEVILDLLERINTANQHAKYLQDKLRLYE